MTRELAVQTQTPFRTISKDIAVQTLIKIGSSPLGSTFSSRKVSIQLEEPPAENIQEVKPKMIMKTEKM